MSAPMRSLHGAGDADVFRIGPNAVLQLLPVLDRTFGSGTADRALAAAGLARPGAESGMLPEADVATLHALVRRTWPGDAAQVLRDAGLATGDYILANRIPAVARLFIRFLPATIGARILSAAIAKHSWTFAGSGRFRILSRSPVIFEIAANPVIAGETSSIPLCHWHAAVFERLFSRLVWPEVAVREVACCARKDQACRFTLMPTGR